MVCMSSYPPYAATLLRRGSRAAGRLNTDWFVVYVETPDESPNRIDSEAQRHLLANIERARDLGAEVVRLQARDPVPGHHRFCALPRGRHDHHQRSHRPWWQQMLGRSIPIRLVKEAAGFDIHIVSLNDPEERP